MCSVSFFLLCHNTCGVSCVELSLIPLFLSASIPCAETGDASPRGPWTVITFRHLVVKVNDAYV